MVNTTIGRTVGLGALAGAVAGGAGAAAMYWLVEPSIRAAIAIEEAGTAAAEAAGHEHMADELVSRGQQVAFGLLTAVIVGTLIGVAFALTHRFLRGRIPGNSAASSSMALAGLGFLAFTLAPAIVIPANPPAVGDPATVEVRTLTYIGTIVCAVALTSAVVAVSRADRLPARQRLVTATGLAIVSVALLKLGIPDVSDSIAPTVPAGLIWDFRLGSLAQIGLMWLVLGAAFGWLVSREEERRLADSSEVRGATLAVSTSQGR
ncbi:CbtA family protein [Nocardia sp. CA-135953]|uniref:CbtA family protein n=1 Tax=Nocardia sp. CA-135953 TaxID=3239978 RepID=UPI003D991627